MSFTLSHGGRVVPGFGLGAAGTFAQAASDLDNALIPMVTYYGDPRYETDVSGKLLDFTDATSAYQAAGNYGATQLGPEIDAAGAPNATQPLTHQAWVLNVQLAALPKSGLPDPKNAMSLPYYTQGDADAARKIVKQMIDLYQQAITAGAGATNQPAPAVTPIPSTPTIITPEPQTQVVPPSSFWPAVAVVAVAGAVGTALYMASKKKRSPAYA